MSGIECKTESVPRRNIEVILPSGKINLIPTEHDQENTSEQVAGSHGIALETGREPAESYMTGDGWIEMLDAVEAGKDPKGEQYGSIIKYARENHVPVIGTDMPLPERILNNETNAMLLSTAAGLGAISAGAIATLIGKAAPKEEEFAMTRRAFLTGGVSLGLVGGYLLSGNAILIAARLPPPKTSEELYAFNARLHQWRGYAKFIGRLRNLVMAEKLIRTLTYLREELGIENPSIAAPIGPNHGRDLKEALEMDPAIRRQFIQDLLTEAEKSAPESKDKIRAVVTAVPVAMSDANFVWQSKILQTQ